MTPRQPVVWGVNFSEKYARELSLDWQATYLAILDELQARRIKVASYWDLLEPESGKFNFDNLDWQINEAAKRQAQVVLVVGLKSPRWPECHAPGWTDKLSREARRAAIIQLVQTVVARYKDSPTIISWQIENEPFVGFGQCPGADTDLLRSEISAARELDAARPILISDSGELSLWLTAARYGDLVGATLYRRVWSSPLNHYLTYPLSPEFYRRRAWVIQYFWGKEVLGVELQAEPWGPVATARLSLADQDQSMSPAHFLADIDFARRVGFHEQYLWGTEWWYFRKQQGNPFFWNEAHQLLTMGR